MKAFYSRQTALHYGMQQSDKFPDTIIIVYYCPKTRYYFVDWKGMRMKNYEQMIQKYLNGKTI